MIDAIKEREIPLLSETVGWVELDIGCGKVWRPITKTEYEQGYYLDLREGSGGQ